MQRSLTCPHTPHHSFVAATKLFCQLCWCPLVTKSESLRPQSHPCLFCPSCVRECARKPEAHRALKVSYHADRRGTDEVEPGQGRGQGHTHYYQRDSSEILLNSSLSRSNGFGKQRPEPSAGVCPDRPVIYRTALSRREKRTFRRKLHELETKATRCGFCPPDGRHEKLVSYCCFCGKHLCRRCHLVHGQDTLYKYHPTVDLTTGVNTALQ